MSTILGSYYQIKIKEKIIEAINNAFKNTTEAEPKMVLNLAREIKKQLDSYEVSDKISFRIGSIFTHQKPQVINIDKNSFWHNKYIEIGDLLLINNLTITDSKEEEITQITKSVALLLQAKKISIEGSKYTIPDNKKQLDLYANWPKFKFRSSKLNIKDEILIDIKTEHDILNGAKYLLINKYRNQYDLSDSVATATSPNLSGFKPFHCELFDFMTGNAGKEFDLNKNDWSNLIKDLIDVISDEKLPPSYRNDFQENRGLFFITSMDGDSLNFGLFRDLYSKYKKENKSNYVENDDEMRGMVIIEINTMINNLEERELEVI